VILAHNLILVGQAGFEIGLRCGECASWPYTLENPVGTAAPFVTLSKKVAKGIAFPDPLAYVAKLGSHPGIVAGNFSGYSRANSGKRSLCYNLPMCERAPHRPAGARKPRV
jgi:hypothetical protein